MTTQLPTRAYVILPNAYDYCIYADLLPSGAQHLFIYQESQTGFTLYDPVLGEVFETFGPESFKAGVDNAHALLMDIKENFQVLQAGQGFCGYCLNSTLVLQIKHLSESVLTDMSGKALEKPTQVHQRTEFACGACEEKGYWLKVPKAEQTLVEAYHGQKDKIASLKILLPLQPDAHPLAGYSRILEAMSINYADPTLIRAHN